MNHTPGPANMGSALISQNLLLQGPEILGRDYDSQLPKEQSQVQYFAHPLQYQHMAAL